jgi:hypothetical protein
MCLIQVPDQIVSLVRVKFSKSEITSIKLKNSSIVLANLARIANKLNKKGVID